MPRFTKGARLAKELRDKTTHTSSKVWPDTAYRSQEKWIPHPLQEAKRQTDEQGDAPVGQSQVQSFPPLSASLPRKNSDRLVHPNRRIAWATTKIGLANII
jgi:hypothetical protein